MKTEEKQGLFRALPSVESVLQDDKIAKLIERWDRGLVSDAVSAEIDALRGTVANGNVDKAELEGMIGRLPDAVAARVSAMTSPGFRRVINATGVVVHTNLGRSPLPAAALERIAELGGRYLDLEYDLESGERGKRDAGCRRLLGLLFPGYDALVVNNNAAAVLLALNTLAEGRQMLISRGQIIEIGESFRINEIQAKSGAGLVEVGTTNRTRIEDYVKAIGPETALLLTAHPSNYRVVGFTAQVTLEELCALGRERNLPVVEDWGSGCIVDPAEYGIAAEESAATILRKGPDAICFSGDKLLGGPQAGIVVGKPEVITRMRANHLYRALRLDKLILIALEETIRLYLARREAEIPTLEMLARTVEDLRRRAEAIAAVVGDSRVGVVDSEARVGGGAAPQVAVPSAALEIDSGGGGAAEELKVRLRKNDPPIVARAREGKVYLDLRAVFPDEDESITAALRGCL